MSGREVLEATPRCPRVAQCDRELTVQHLVVATGNQHLLHCNLEVGIGRLTLLCSFPEESSNKSNSNSTLDSGRQGQQSQALARSRVPQ